MSNMFDFNNVEKCEEIIKEKWNEFREALAKGRFTYDQVDEAKKTTFLRVYEDLFNSNAGIEQKTITIGELKYKKIGRGTILKKDENPNYERFLPKAEYIRDDNRFSPKGVEWLYLAIGEESDIYRCAVAECRAKTGNRFAFCNFEFEKKYSDCKLVDLTIADAITYKEINQELDNYFSLQKKRAKNVVKCCSKIPIMYLNKHEQEKKILRWSVYTYAKLLSEQIFVPLKTTDNKSIAYAPFQTIAQYYISLGYSGIIFGSTVCPVGKNIVLFDKQMAYPIGTIDITIVP